MMRVAILHPDLGIGGAERLIVDAALALKAKGHEVKVITNHHDPSHAFKECSGLDITVCFSWVPRSICGSFMAFFAYLRMILAAIYLCFFVPSDVILVDQISACLPILRLFTSSRVIFYCHFPDLLLTERTTTAKKAYRAVIDWLEESTIGWAHVICVNSNFTASVVRLTFPRLAQRELTVLYPSLNTEFFDKCEGEPVEQIQSSQAQHVFLSLNRFEAKKNINLAIDAFVALSKKLTPEEYQKCYLVLAGGYDKHCMENLICHRQLREYALNCGISPKQHTFLRSPSDASKMWLLRTARAVLYTPSREHFGIVPVEAMYSRTPVIAVNTGGPTESVVHGETGFLVEPDANQFADCMARLVRDESLQQSMSAAGPRRVRAKFSFDAFTERLNEIATVVK